MDPRGFIFSPSISPTAASDGAGPVPGALGGVGDRGLEQVRRLGGFSKC